MYNPQYLIANTDSTVVADDAVYGPGLSIIRGTGQIEFHAEPNDCQSSGLAVLTRRPLVMMEHHYTGVDRLKAAHGSMGSRSWDHLAGAWKGGSGDSLSLGRRGRPRLRWIGARRNPAGF